MVRLTSLLKSRNVVKSELDSSSGEEKNFRHDGKKGNAMFLQSADLDLLRCDLPKKEKDCPPKDELFSIDTAAMAEESMESSSMEKAHARIPVDPVTHSYPRLEEASGQGSVYLSKLRQESLQADTIYIETLDLLEEVYRRNFKERERMIEIMVAATTRLIDFCRLSNVILRKAVRLNRETSSLAEHSLKVAILAIKIGFSRDYSPERLFSLTFCALLGDIGMTRIDPAILAKSERLNSGEIDEVRMHIKYTQEILAKDFREFPFLIPIVGQIHERENGSGYPRGLKGENIHEFAKIIGLSDVYIAMTTRKAHREDFSGYITLQQIIARRGIDFYPQIIKSLIDVISVFPLESLVKLNNGAIGRVIDISSKHPTRPKLIILINSDGERLHTPKFLDLEQEPLLYVETPDIEEGVIL